MTDPLGLIGQGGVAPIRDARGASGPGAPQAPGASFKDALLRHLDEVNQLQNDANRAIEDYVTGRGTGVEDVLLATSKADLAFKMLQAVRNKVVDAYQEIQQIRV